ncbi:PilN domain-containing protein [Enterovibrio nigricans]|uniref:Type IV pilus assembly protein PilN n=1 Tax=Enterovibrio nigricans DSM 22720 TaxID=1121868 RepID=A0A1T4U8J2_9GAMM|nr:PilN domain-containing protein [Enterovibrio nigricans]SKA49102.1 type IV pilus assembly protein PilN [Enterovibrio nigricans DSM 22720]
MRNSINLLPWRENKRLETRKQFYVEALLVTLLVIGFLGIAFLNGERLLSAQEVRNTRLETEIQILDKKLAEFTEKKLARDALEQRLALVNSLQIQRNNTTLLFNLLPEVTPDGVVLDSVTLKQGKVSVKGRSRSNAQLASLLALLEAKPGASDVQIHSIINNENSKQDDGAANSFLLTFSLAAFVSLELSEEGKHGR